MDKQFLYAGALAVLVVAGAVLIGTGEEGDAGGMPETGETGGPPAWATVNLTDVRTGDTFTIASFDRPVLVESFAVWCPTCTRQQKEIQNLHQQVGDDIISVSVDTDPNEDAAKVRAHIEQHGFDWRYVVAPASFTQPFIEQFGRDVVNAPLAPVVVVCPDGTAEQLPNGVKPASTLQDAVEQRC
ncbi:MAG: redoxin family protein [Candidatus Nanohaloarchaea archaeon]|nr:redoxin family protein [Candidatus Nanohaloarchaea archaeon]